jgi:uncharacterized membrane protein
MNLPAELRTHDPRQSLSTLTHVMYALHIASFFSAGIFSVIAIIINYIKRDDLPDLFFRSHFRWQARSFWFTLLWLVVTSPTWIVFLGWIPWIVIWLWYLYRFLRGWLAFADGRPMPYPPELAGSGAAGA